MEIVFDAFLFAVGALGFLFWRLHRISERRHISVMVLIDEDSSFVPEYTREMMMHFYETFAFVSEVFRREFNITFSIRDFRLQKFEQDAYGVRTDAFWRNTKHMHSHLPSEIIVGFTENAISAYQIRNDVWERCDTVSQGQNVGGIVDPKRSGGILIQVTGSVKVNTFFAIHEIAHLFGARHTDSEEDTMYGGSTLALPLHFDSLNKTIIYFLNKHKKFTKEMIP